MLVKECWLPSRYLTNVLVLPRVPKEYIANKWKYTNCFQLILPPTKPTANEGLSYYTSNLQSLSLEPNVQETSSHAETCGSTLKVAVWSGTAVQLTTGERRRPPRIEQTSPVSTTWNRKMKSPDRCQLRGRRNWNLNPRGGGAPDRCATRHAVFALQ